MKGLPYQSLSINAASIGPCPLYQWRGRMTVCVPSSDDSGCHQPSRIEQIVDLNISDLPCGRAVFRCLPPFTPRALEAPHLVPLSDWRAVGVLVKLIDSGLFGRKVFFNHHIRPRVKYQLVYLSIRRKSTCISPTERGGMTWRWWSFGRCWLWKRERRGTRARCIP